MRPGLTGAIYRLASTGTVMINPHRCINCAFCAMACPYGVIRYHEDPLGPPGMLRLRRDRDEL